MWVRDQRNSWHGIEFPYHGRAEQTVAEMYRRYCEMVLSVDESVGRVLTALKRMEITDDTLIIFTSDGGHLWGEHGLIDKRCAYEASIRIPFLFHWPKAIKPGSICSAIATNIDVAPTLLALAGIPIPAEVDGSSLRKFLFEPGSVDERHPFVYEYYWDPSFPHTPTTFAVRNERFKLIQYHGIWDTDELYDLKADPQETTNLILEPAYQDRVEELREILYQRLLQTRGLSIRLGRKRDHGQNLRSAANSKRSSFPSHMISMPSEDR
jgi:N-acetylglucosamine-6-sulfatase